MADIRAADTPVVADNRAADIRDKRRASGVASADIAVRRAVAEARTGERQPVVATIDACN